MGDGKGDVSPEDIAADLGIDTDDVAQALRSQIDPLSDIETIPVQEGVRRRGRPRVEEERKAVTIYLKPADVKKMKALAVEYGKKIYEMYDEGISLVLHKYKDN